MDFVVYFYFTCLGSSMHIPTFRKDMWNVFERVRNDIPRTTNSLEGWHRAFHSRLGQTNPTANALVQALRVEQSHWELQIAQWENGIPMPTTKKIYQDLNNKLKLKVNTYLLETNLNPLNTDNL